MARSSVAPMRFEAGMKYVLQSCGPIVLRHFKAAGNARRPFLFLTAMVWPDSRDRLARDVFFIGISTALRHSHFSQMKTSISFSCAVCSERNTIAFWQR